jgi:hypothetical protein
MAPNTNDTAVIPQKFLYYKAHTGFSSSLHCCFKQEQIDHSTTWAVVGRDMVCWSTPQGKRTKVECEPTDRRGICGCKPIEQSPVLEPGHA